MYFYVKTAYVFMFLCFGECSIIVIQSVPDESRSLDITPLTFVKMGLQPSSQVQFGAHRYWQSCPTRILNAIGCKTITASIPCLQLKVLNCKNSRRLNSYIGAGIFLRVPAKKTDNSCILTMMATKMVPKWWDITMPRQFGGSIIINNIIIMMGLSLAY